MEHLKCFSEKILLRALRFIWRARTHISASTQLHRADQQQRDQANSLCSETFYLVWESWTFIMNCSSVCSCEDHLQFLEWEWHRGHSLRYQTRDASLCICGFKRCSANSHPFTLLLHTDPKYCLLSKVGSSCTVCSSFVLFSSCLYITFHSSLSLQKPYWVIQTHLTRTICCCVLQMWSTSWSDSLHTVQSSHVKESHSTLWYCRV